MAPALPVDRSGDFGRSPFFGQLSGKLPPATVYTPVVLKSKHKGVWKTFSAGGRRELLLLAANDFLVQISARGQCIEEPRTFT